MNNVYTFVRNKIWLRQCTSVYHAPRSLNIIRYLRLYKMWNSTSLRWTSTLFDICMCLYNAYTRCNNAINRVRWRYNLEMRSRVISQALACMGYNYTQLFTLIYLLFHPPVNQFPREVLPHLPQYYDRHYFYPYVNYCLVHLFIQPLFILYICRHQ